MIDFTRRELLAGSAGLATIMALGGCESLKQSIANRPVRRDIANLALNSPTIQTFKAGVQAMRDLPSSDPRNWTNWAEQHLDHCPHGNWFFLPWHRAYLLSLERIIQKLTNTPSFGLPYWNWSCNRSVPAPFWEAGSPLLHTRNATSTSQANIDLVGQENINEILEETDFELFASGASTALRGGGGFYGRLESQPHNHIHPFVGGDMGGYMSPLDPVFWTHHNNLDYLWWVWNNAGNANTNDGVYTGFDIGHMVDGDGNPTNYRVGALILAPLLSYRFEAPRRCLRMTDFRLRDTAALRRLLEEGSSIRFEPRRSFPPVSGVRLAVGQRQRARIPIPAEALAGTFEANSPERLLLRIEDVTPPAREDFYVQVYVNLREGETPSSESPSYAGAFAFFVDERAGHHMTHNYLVDLSGAIDRLREAGRLATGGAGADITLVAVPNLPERPAEGVVSIGRIAPITIARRPLPRPPQ